MKTKSKFYRKANSINNRSLLSNQLNGKNFKFKFIIPELEPKRIIQNKSKFTKNSLKVKGLYVRKAKSLLLEVSPESDTLSHSKSLNLEDVANKCSRFNFNVKSAKFRRDYHNCEKNKFLKKKLKIKALFFKRARFIRSNLRNNFKFQFEIDTSVDGRGEA